MPTTLAPPLLSRLEDIPGARLLRPGDAPYERAAEPMNTDLAGRPAAVVQCTDPAAVRAAFAACTDAGSAVAVRGGGYSVGGTGSSDGGVVVDLSPMRSLRVDTEAGTVTVGPGVTAGELERALAPTGLALNLPVPSSPSVIGAALSGGVGFTLRRLGFLCDALVSATLVDATGRTVEADDAREPELMRALRGAGGNFGAVVRATFRAARIRDVDAAQRFYALDDLPAVLRLLRDAVPAAAAELTAVAMVLPLPPLPGARAELHGRPALLVSAVDSGDGAAADGLAGALGSGPAPLGASRARLPLVDLRATTDAAHPIRRFGVRARSGWVRRVDEAAGEALGQVAAALPAHGEGLVELAWLGGAVADPDVASAMPGRTSAAFSNSMAMWHDPQARVAALGWLESTAAARARLHDGAAVAPGFASCDQLHLAAETFSGDLERLRAVKRHHDPANLLRSNLNVEPVGQTHA